MGSVRVAIVGVGNCASSLVQGLEYYKDADDSSRVPGLMHVRFGPYHVRDVEVVAAFDVDAKKVGVDVADAINASENNTIKIADVPPTGVTVQRGPTFDGLGEYYRDIITESDQPAVDVVAALRAARLANPDRVFPIAPVYQSTDRAAPRGGVRRLHIPKQPTSAPSCEHIAGGTRRKWGDAARKQKSTWIGKRMVRLPSHRHGFWEADLLHQIITPSRSSIWAWNLFDCVRARVVLSRVQGRKEIRDDRDSYSSDGPVQCRYLRRPRLGRFPFADLTLRPALTHHPRSSEAIPKALINSDEHQSKMEGVPCAIATFSLTAFWR